jgi:hypothetical protein
VAQAPEALLDRYLEILAKQKIRMTPTEHRPTIIFKFYDVFCANPGRTLSELKEDLHAYFEETAPNIKWQYVHETVHQLFHTYCFTFQQGNGKYPSDVRLWDRQFHLAGEINSAADLLARCDRGLLYKIGRRLGSGGGIDPDVAARLLYGRVKGHKMLEHIDKLIGEAKRQGDGKA